MEMGSDHEESRKRLFELYDGELPLGERSKVETHLEGCASCREVYERWSRLAGALFSASEPPVPEAFVGRVMAGLDAEAVVWWQWPAPAWGLGFAAALLAVSLTRRAEPVLPEDLLLAGGQEDAAVEWLLRASGPGPDEWLGSVLEEP